MKEEEFLKEHPSLKGEGIVLRFDKKDNILLCFYEDNGYQKECSSCKGKERKMTYSQNKSP